MALASDMPRKVAVLDNNNRFNTLRLPDDDVPEEHSFQSSSPVWNPAVVPFKSKAQPSSFRKPQNLTPRDSHSLCATCQSIFDNSPEFDKFGETKAIPHHSLHTSFLAAVEAGCYICLLLQEKIISRDVPNQPPTSPLVNGSHLIGQLSWH